MFELASVIFLGVLAQWISWRIKVPAILPLILIGLFVGPLSFLWLGTPPSIKYIEPIFNGDSGFFPADNFFYFITLAIGIILFEGGLTLNRNEIMGIGGTVVNLITVGSLVTFIGAGVAAHFVMDLSWTISFLFSALIIVTGPTVIAPILRNVALKRDVSNVLKWEGILIDPIGALAAVLVYKFIISNAGGEYGLTAIISFSRVLFIGFGIGVIFAFIFKTMLVQKIIPHFLLNISTLAYVLFVFVFSDALFHESGLLSVVIMGMVLGNMNLPQLKEILHFNETLSLLLISILFILLSANVDYQDLLLIFNWQCVSLFLVVILVVRPLGVFLSTLKSENLNIRDKLFISWVGPRGIVAAGIASLFGLRLVGKIEGAEYITPLVFMIVLGTVLLNATTARIVARLLGVVKSSSDGVLIVGASTPARLIGQYIKKSGRHVILLDRSETNIRAAQTLGLEAINADVYSDDLYDKFDLLDVGLLMAFTTSEDVNDFVIAEFKDEFGELGCFKILSPEELSAKKKVDGKTVLFSKTDDFINISEIARDYPEFHEVEITDEADYVKKLKTIRMAHNSVPVFYKTKDHPLKVINGQETYPNAEEVITQLVYLGEKCELESTKADDENT